MEMTFEQYIQNPLGKENAVFSNRAMYKELYTNKLNKLLVREVGKTTYNIYMDKEQDKYYVYFKIPSEVIKDFYYDTVIEFYPKKKELKLERSLKNYSIKFYSNDPSFVFTFAYAFNKQNMIIEEFKSKLPKKSLTDRAVEKNPKALIGYVKSIYFSYLLMNRYSLFNKIVYETSGVKYNKSDLLKQIMPAEEKINLRMEGQKELDKQKHIEKQKAKQSANHSTGYNKDLFTDKSTISKITKVSTTPKVSTSVKLSKKTNKVGGFKRRKIF